MATDIVDPETGEIVMRANDELTEDSLGRLRAANIHEFRTLYTNDLDAGPFISQTLRLDDSADQISARIAIYRMMRRVSRRPRTQSRHCSTASSTTRTPTTCRAWAG